MTLSPTILAAVLWMGVAHAQDEADEPPEEPPASDAVDDDLSRHRTNFDVLSDRAIGTTSRPVEFNWRRTTVQVAATGGYLFELNNFNSMRGGAMARLPSGGLLLEFGLSYASAWDSPSSLLMSLTPYRQPGRPNRMELDFTVGFPLAEGVVTTVPRIFPAVEMVFNAYAGVRYVVYPTGYGGMSLGQVTGAIFSPTLSEIEIDNLDDARLAAMQVDLGRYGLMLGFGNDLYFKQGVFLSPRMMLAIPILAPASGTELLVWADFTMAVGVAF